MAKCDIESLNWREVELEEAIDWNSIEDPLDLEIWNRLWGNFWLPEKIALSNDITSWSNLTEDEQLATTRVFAGLTLLDTIQGNVGAISLMPDSRTPHEEAVYCNIAAMEQVHAKSYSSIFSTLLSSSDISDTFRWSRENEYLKKKAAIILHYYRGDDPEKRKIASTLLESFLFYSGFFMPLWWSSKGKLTNTADIIRLIIRDESIHGYYIGAKFNLAYKESSPARQRELNQFAIDLMETLYENEVHYTEYLYDAIGLTEYVKPFLRYNAVKAFQNLGLEEPFTPEETEVLPQILSSLNPTGDENFDFFSGAGANYSMGASKTDHLDEDEWEDLFD